MPYKIAGIDVHKRMLHVVVSDVEVDGEYEFTRRVFGSQPEALRSLATWLVEQEAEEVVMESTAQYWRPVWEALERYWKPDCQKRQGAHSTSGTLHLAQAQSNRGRRGRKKDFRDAERLVKRLVANELVLSFVPDAEQRLWRTVMRTKYQGRRNRVQLQNRLEALLEEAHIKISSLVSDLLGVSARRMLKAIAEGQTDPATVVALADERLQATPEQLRDALGVCRELNPLYRRLIRMALEEVASIDKRIEQLDQEMADLLRRHEDQVQRLAEVPGLGADSAQQIIAEVGATAATFPSEKHLSSWVGACPGSEESAEVNNSGRSPHGNRHMRRILSQAANSAVKHNGSIFEIFYRRYVPRLGHKHTIAIIAHKLCRLIWKILHRGMRYEERGPDVNKKSKQARAQKMIRELRRLGYRVEPTTPQPALAT
ncbi:MAG TPA: IS110 family transposase [Candidatus Acidoferrales bacterium]|nr:IS110 family transposase [Candidatus Acidoferrales bacterium]